ncbi:DUF2779 domain-containing protein [Pollutibacter soli]|uniref:DUF2779 domain-containing protein n=1 Tax=Pollutibacter soli TaxID=3034157 RepID=UPI003013F95B
MPYFTKSKFRLALDCPTGLYYGTNKNLYADKNVEDSFLQALAEGGYQVGELAKYLFCDDPVKENITVDTLDYDESLAITAEKRNQPGRKVIAEAAFRFEQFFVRCDLIVEESDRIDLYEVKAKSWDETVEFLTEVKKGPERGTYRMNKAWKNYLYDVAFQKWVIEKANPGKIVRAHLILADKTSTATIDGLNQLFRIGKDANGRTRISVRPEVTAADLGQIPLRIINVDDVYEFILNHPVDIELPEEYAFESLLYFLNEKLQANEIIWSGVGKKCRDCQFVNADYPDGLSSGFHECWVHAKRFSDEDFRRPLVLNLWAGKAGARSIVNDLITNGKVFLTDVETTDFASRTWVDDGGDRLDATKRRSVQIIKSRNKDYSPHLEMDGLRRLFDELQPPYHFIDFETTMVALPFHKKRRPYEAIAFQYSYHLMDETGNIRHQSQYLSFDRGAFPNYDFLRSLRRDLEGKPGTIFRYHDHENNYLNHLHKQLWVESITDVPDRNELLKFIETISTSTNTNGNKWQAINPMQDLYKMVIEHFYSLHAGGSNSIKYILPAVIRSSDDIREKYSRPVYGGNGIPSLNFSNPHVWIREDKDFNPYNTLASLPGIPENLNLDLNDSTDIEVKDGGAAMMAFAKLQFSEMPEAERILYRDALLRYCELDTMAMVMIWEWWGKELGRW